MYYVSINYLFIYKKVKISIKFEVVNCSHFNIKTVMQKIKH